MTAEPAPADFSRWRSINGNSKAEVAYWAVQMTCSHAELIHAISLAGIMVVDVRAALLEIAESLRKPPPL